jgi:uncharacterized membrane protein
LETVTIFFGAVASILAYITKAKWKELSTIGKSSLIIGIIAVIFGAILAHTKAKKEALIERIEAPTARLEIRLVQHSLIL